MYIYLFIYIGAAIGGTIGGILGVLCVCVFVFFFIKRRQGQQQIHPNSLSSSSSSARTQPGFCARLCGTRPSHYGTLLDETGLSTFSPPHTSTPEVQRRPAPPSIRMESSSSSSFSTTILYENPTFSFDPVGERRETRQMTGNLPSSIIRFPANS